MTVISDKIAPIDTTVTDYGTILIRAWCLRQIIIPSGWDAGRNYNAGSYEFGYNETYG